MRLGDVTIEIACDGAAGSALGRVGGIVVHA